MRRFLGLPVLAVALCLATWPGAGAFAGDDPETSGVETVDQTLCRAIESSATANGLPVGFFTRLIWRESSLRANVTSPAGAQGIAQFMPGTAAERGLASPFDPEKAIPEAARLLADLSKRFGNLGLAAAAYNAGPNLIAKWLSGQADAPLETRAYVFAITALPLEEWSKAQPASFPPTPDEPCQQIVDSMRRSAPAETVGATPFAPWGVQLTGNFSKDIALRAFARARQKYKIVIGDVEPFVLASRIRSRGTRTFFRVRAPEPSQAAAEQFCRKLRSVGGSCIVLRS